MALVSIQRALAKAEEDAAYRRVISMVLEGVATHALNIDREARQSFRDRIGEIRQGMASETAVEALLGHGGAAVQAMGEYARETARVVNAQGAEMQDMIAMLTRAVVEIGGAGGRGAARLRKIGDDLEHAAPLNDVFTLRARLRECLGAVRTEARQQEAESQRMVQELRQALSRRQGLDPVTELPGEIAARAQFLCALRTGEQKYVAVFVLGSARHINLRFGRPAGDDFVRALKQHLEGHLETGDRMFRWSGPAIAALLDSREPLEQVRARLHRFLEQPIERTFQVSGRPVPVRLSVAWSVFTLSPPLTVMNRQIHDFVASQGYSEEDPIPA